MRTIQDESEPPLITLTDAPGARAEAVSRRVARILAETILPKRMTWKAWSATIACILPLAAITACAVAQAPSQREEDRAVTSDPDTLARRQEEQKKPRTEIQIGPKLLDNYVGYYVLAPSAIFTVTRQGDSLFVQLTGQASFQVYAESANKFFYKVVPAQISFNSDGQSRATELVLHQNGAERPARRISQADAQSATDSLAKRVKDGVPVPGSEAALRRQIEAFMQRQPNYDDMTDELAAVTRPQIPKIDRQFAALGPLQSISFRGVGLQGWDIYEVRFENGISIWRIFLAPDKKVSGLLFQSGP
jgi:hypothetical protein